MRQYSWNLLLPSLQYFLQSQNRVDVSYEDDPHVPTISQNMNSYHFVLTERNRPFPPTAVKTANDAGAPPDRLPPDSSSPTMGGELHYRLLI